MQKYSDNLSQLSLYFFQPPYLHNFISVQRRRSIRSLFVVTLLAYAPVGVSEHMKP